MSGHSKWSTIKHKKGAADAKRGKVFTKHAKLITIAAQSGGGDPNMNPGLRSAIDSAKAANVPNTNIERAIKKGTGELKDGNIIEETTYEGYGPAGVAIIIDCLTDNKNRAFANIRNIVNKCGGNIGESGCVSWMFKKMGVIYIEVKENKDEAELQAIDLGAEDVKWDGDSMEVYTTVESFEQVKKALNKAFSVQSSELEMVPQTKASVETVDKAKQVLKLLDDLNEDEDVSNVWENMEISDIIMAQISEE